MNPRRAVGKYEIQSLLGAGGMGEVCRAPTRFTSELILRHAPSRGGKQFAVARGISSADIILIRDFR